jgi:hypothetical protein
MARGDVVVFDEAKAKMLAGNWATTDDFWVGLITSAVTPTAADATPTYTDYTDCTAGGNYAAGGKLLDSLADLVTEVAGTMTFGDILTTSAWLQNAANPQDAAFAVVYNYTDAGKDAVAFVDLAGPVNMRLGDLTITWNAAGIFTIT